MPNLYELTAAARGLFVMITDPDITEEERDAVLARHRQCTTEELPAKMEARAIIIQNLKADAEQQKMQADYHARRAKAAKANADWLARDTLGWIEHAGLDKYRAGVFTLSSVKCGGKLTMEIDATTDPVNVGASWTRLVPQHFEFDNDAIRAALENGERLPLVSDGADPDTGELQNVRPLAKLKERGTRLSIR